MPSNELYLDCATAALTALAEAGIPADIQELLVRGDVSRGIAPGALSKAVKASSDIILAALLEPTREMYESAHKHYEGEAYLPHGLWRAMLAASALGEQSE